MTLGWRADGVPDRPPAGGAVRCGIPGALRKAVRQFLLWHRELAWVFDAPCAAAETMSLEPGTSIHAPCSLSALQSLDLSALAAMEGVPLGMYRQWVAEHLAAGGVVAIASRASTAAHVRLANVGGTVRFGVHATRELVAGEAYMHGARTAPAYRGQGLAPATGSMLLRHLMHDVGCSRVLAVCLQHNYPSIVQLSKMGFRYDHTMFTLQPLGALTGERLQATVRYVSRRPPTLALARARAGRLVPRRGPRQ